MVTKEFILAEAKRIAELNGGKSPGIGRFESETSIKDWRNYWARWNEVLRDADLPLNEMVSAIPIDSLLEKLAQYSVQLGRLPTGDDIHVKSKSTPGFPSKKTFLGRLGKRPELVRKLREFCLSHNGFEVVIRFCDEYVPRKRAETNGAESHLEDIGFVYLNRIRHKGRWL